LEQAGISDYELIEYTPTTVDKIINILLNPFVQGLLIMIIIGGLYFELQTPGVGFPLGAAALSAILYFAPLYLQGLADHWEMIIFIIGIILIAVEIFAIPGFGVAGIAGITLAIAGLTMAMVDNLVFELGDITLAINTVMRAFVVVLLSVLFSLILSIWLGKKIVTSPLFPGLALNDIQAPELGFLGVDMMQSTLVGREGNAYTVLRPSGKVEIDGEVYDAKSIYGFINRGSRVKVIRYESGQIYVEEI
jgi:membrane-bound serine protease (ClpP class)